MASRVGIELLPGVCRLVEIDAGRASGRTANEARVRAFDVLATADGEIEARLPSYRRRDAAVVVWGVPADHRQVVVTAGTYDAMRAEALQVLGCAGIATRGMWTDITPAIGSDPGPDRGQTPGTPRRTVLVTLAASAPLAAALQPLVDAGIRVRSVATPAAALSSIARLRRAFCPPRAIEAYIAIEERVSCVALVRDGGLTTARHLAWGYGADRGDGRQHRTADDLAGRLADELHDFCAAIDQPVAAISQVCICGGAPGLRNMTERLSSRFGAPVQALDSLFGIDAAHLPDPAGEFRSRSVEWRLAWAVAVDWPPPINVARVRNWRHSRVALKRAAVGAGIAAGLLTGWRIERSDWWQSIGPRPASRAARAAAVSAGLRAATAEAHTPPPALTFDAVLGTILYSEDRRLAVIDGRIVAAGDDVRGARVVEITPHSVTLRDSQGRTRLLTRSNDAH